MCGATRADSPCVSSLQAVQGRHHLAGMDLCAGYDRQSRGQPAATQLGALPSPEHLRVAAQAVARAMLARMFQRATSALERQDALLVRGPFVCLLVSAAARLLPL